MINYRTIEKNLLRQIEEEKGFSFRKLKRIIKLNSLYKNIQVI